MSKIQYNDSTFEDKLIKDYLKIITEKIGNSKLKLMVS
jgi:hypothetical protein